MPCLFTSRLVNGATGDPGLYCEMTGQRRGLLFDLGDVTALMPRELLRVSHAFVSHTHMDHFAGFDHLLRVVLGRQPRLVLMGGPGFVDRLGHKLAAYTWNLVHNYEVALDIEAHEFRPEGRRRRALFSSRDRFERTQDEEADWDGDLLHDEDQFRVRGRFVDHGIPVLAFALEEKARVAVNMARLQAAGFTTGAWLRELKSAVLAGAPGATPIEVRWTDRGGEHVRRRTVDELRPLVLDERPGRCIGYVTDLCGSEADARVLAELLRGVDQLHIECVFLDADRAHAERKHHLTARRAGEIARLVGARELVPFHFSPRYEGRSEALRDEAMRVWRAD
ncbi:ribonuclease Z [Azohydromonas aeria]|uniref:ribonuclease Z n=1 Tax=Azohydromonas aeria TaxID=2590212 RepID=UPI0012F77FB2|nr:MBL fold metallo-hydrolase [Azohydromonas aeria]